MGTYSCDVVRLWDAKEQDPAELPVEDPSANSSPCQRSAMATLFVFSSVDVYFIDCKLVNWYSHSVNKEHKDPCGAPGLSWGRALGPYLGAHKYLGLSAQKGGDASLICTSGFLFLTSTAWVGGEAQALSDAASGGPRGRKSGLPACPPPPQEKCCEEPGPAHISFPDRRQLARSDILTLDPPRQ